MTTLTPLRCAQCGQLVGERSLLGWHQFIFWAAVCALLTFATGLWPKFPQIAVGVFAAAATLIGLEWGRRPVSLLRPQAGRLGQRLPQPDSEQAAHPRKIAMDE